MRAIAALLFLLFCAAPSVRAAAVQPPPTVQPPPAAEQPATDPRVALLKLLPAGSKLDDLRPSPIAGIYEFMQGAEISYITADGKYFIDGNLYDMKSRDNLTEGLRTHARIALINSVPESEMLIFSPPNPKYTITVFTDVDCAYCRKLHSQVAELNRLGIARRVLRHFADLIVAPPPHSPAMSRRRALISNVGSRSSGQQKSIPRRRPA